ncbi:MAG: FG-GAP-like repeat-containing protein [Opitutaceae bacterium]
MIPSILRCSLLVPTSLLIAAVASFTRLEAQNDYSTPYTFTTLAGAAGGPGVTDGTGAAARFRSPAGIATDNVGNTYVADVSNHLIRKVTPAGVVTTFAGTAGTPGSADGTGTAATFNYPNDVAINPSDNTLYVADTGNSTIRKITAAGVVTTLAGTAGSTGSADGTGAAARFLSPFGVTTDTAGNVYVADTYNQVIRRITPAGVVTTLAGSASAPGYTDGSGSGARFDYPIAITIDSATNILFVAEDGASTIRKVTSVGVVTTIAGSAGNSGSTDGTGSAARFLSPRSLVVDGAGNLIVADSGNNLIRQISPAGVVTTLAGRAGIPGFSDGTGSSALFASPRGVSLSPTHVLYVSDTSGCTIRRGTFQASVPGDLNGDGKSDLVLTNVTTGERAVWLMNGPSIASGTSLGILATNYIFSASGDFNGDGKSDLFLTNTTTGDRAMWLMNGATISAGASVGNLPVGWIVSGAGDFDGDGKADVVLTNTTTGERVVWLMNGATISTGASLGILSTNWVISQVGDFNGDGKADIILSNVSTGERVVWLMNGTTISSGTSLGILPTVWSLAGAGDFNGDGKCDILLSNSATGERAIWLMNGAAIASGGSLGILPVSWTVSRVGDFNGDGKADIFLTNGATGERVIWTMNGTAIASGASLGILATNWVFLAN